MKNFRRCRLRHNRLTPKSNPVTLFHRVTWELTEYFCVNESSCAHSMCAHSFHKGRLRRNRLTLKSNPITPFHRVTWGLTEYFCVNES